MVGDDAETAGDAIGHPASRWGAGRSPLGRAHVADIVGSGPTVTGRGLEVYRPGTALFMVYSRRGNLWRGPVADRRPRPLWGGIDAMTLGFQPGDRPVKDGLLAPVE
jgi:hypothetical protein